MTMMITYHDIERVGGGGDHSDGTGGRNHKGVMARHRNRVPSKIFILLLEFNVMVVVLQCCKNGKKCHMASVFVKTN